ncbi:hypothetical protein [Mycoplasmopsis verecunda]|uniref:Uncharacterized protein n=1 Tax=Mycoplasmopsis verecunda TaxID=171291 RepID=A0A1T4MDQ8_9BACT|nr:hypothetical protein [Mycoplasmopsis verecunda]WPB54567.1 hypothetical protein SAM46_00135 [Mycoplasmopsis verecunda]SJZ65072.1 hypothetical protein SAMN02745154_00693 [Mycoplasmopsis verecunda]
MKNDLLNAVVAISNTANAINPLNNGNIQNNEELLKWIKPLIDTFSEYDKNIILTYYDTIDKVTSNNFLKNSWLYKLIESTLSSERYHFISKTLQDSDLDDVEMLKHLSEKLNNILINKAIEYNNIGNKKIKDEKITLAAGNAGAGLLGAFLFFAPYIAAAAAIAANTAGGLLISEGKELKTKAADLEIQVSSMKNDFSKLANNFSNAFTYSTILDLSQKEKNDFKNVLHKIIDNCDSILQKILTISNNIDDKYLINQINNVKNVINRLRNSIIIELSILNNNKDNTTNKDEFDNYAGIN